MGVGLYLVGRHGNRGILARSPAPESWLRRVEVWVREQCGEMLVTAEQVADDDGPTLILHLHPVEEPVMLTGGKRGVVQVQAKTSTAGPGYHFYVCDLLKRLGEEFRITWDPQDDEEGTGDETDYFHSGEKASVEREMLSWLGAMARLQLDPEEVEDGPSQWCLPLGHLYEGDGQTLTPLGPRDRAWMEAVAADPKAGLDFFAWWRDAQDAEYYLRRALTLMWREVRWREPLVEEEAELLAEVARLLERAYRLNSTLDFPWREWQEILRYLEQDSTLAMEVARQAENVPAGPLIGYRRGAVTAFLTRDWSIRVPGSFTELWEGDTWSAWEPPRTVWFSSFAFDNPECPTPTAEEALEVPGALEGEVIEYKTPHMLGCATLRQTEEDGQTYWLLSARSAAPGALALCTICFDDLADRDWAIETWHSLQYQSGEEPA